jgi:serine protease Do
MKNRNFLPLIVILAAFFSSLSFQDIIRLQQTQKGSPSQSKVFQSEVQAGSRAQEQANFVDLAEKVMPSVVNISTVTTVDSPFAEGDFDEELFREFFEDFFDDSSEQPHSPHGSPGEMPHEDMPFSQRIALGTGFIIESNGLILTNNHVVANAERIEVSFAEEVGQESLEGEVVGRDPELDIALIQVEAKGPLQAIPLGDSDSLRIGEYVLAVGNPFGQEHSVTHGIISGKERFAPDMPLTRYLQTDAPINPGNSGGPLVNMAGEVVAVSNAILAHAQGIGFAIPINVVKEILPVLQEKGRVERGYIGILVNELTPEIAGELGLPSDAEAPFITHVLEESPAFQAGLQPYDVILEIDGQEVNSSVELIQKITSVPVGERAQFTIFRDGSEESVTLRVAERPQEDFAPEQSGEDETSPSSVTEKVGSGIEIEALDPQKAAEMGHPENLKGLVVVGVLVGSPADRAGLSLGDVILEVNRDRVQKVEDFYEIVSDPGTYLLRVKHLTLEDQEAVSVIVLEIPE